MQFIKGMVSKRTHLYVLGRNLGQRPPVVVADSVSVDDVSVGTISVLSLRKCA
jgi:hypothetical protein